MTSRAVFIVCTLGGLLSLGWLVYPRARMIDDNLGLDSKWHPNAEEIALAVGAGPIGTFDDARHVKFCALFKKRYRDNYQAVGAKFMSENRLKAMFAPVMPRWDMARVAVEMYNEARNVFGRDYEVDIYETYITAPMRKLAEVRAEPGTSQVRVTFDSRFAAERLVDPLRRGIPTGPPHGEPVMTIGPGH